MGAPLAIGGVGGSGTRVVAALVAALGWRGGPDLNGPLDNLWFTLLFKAAEVPDLAPDAFAARAAIFVAAMEGSRTLDAGERALVRELAAQPRPGHPPEWLRDRVHTLLTTTREPRPLPAPWYWKEPNTHIVLPQWRRFQPDLRYVHVVRDGLDMALSDNRNQPRLWGERLLGRPLGESARDSLAYWVAAHRRVAAIGETMPGDFLWLDFDRLCAQPEEGLKTLARFLDVPESAALALRPMLRTPETSGRGQQADPGAFDPDDLAYVESLKAAGEPQRFW